MLKCDVCSLGRTVGKLPMWQLSAQKVRFWRAKHYREAVAQIRDAWFVKACLICFSFSPEKSFKDRATKSSGKDRALSATYLVKIGFSN